jgi:hypothetical protein
METQAPSIDMCVSDLYLERPGSNLHRETSSLTVESCHFVWTVVTLRQTTASFFQTFLIIIYMNTAMFVCHIVIY